VGRVEEGAVAPEREHDIGRLGELGDRALLVGAGPDHPPIDEALGHALIEAEGEALVVEPADEVGGGLPELLLAGVAGDAVGHPKGR
jgi:hypothetical protein